MTGRSAPCSSCRRRRWRGLCCRRDGRWCGSVWRRQIERCHEVTHFLAGRDMAHGERRPDTATTALEVEQGQAVQKQLAIDHALAEARGNAEADPPGQ